MVEKASMSLEERRRLGRQLRRHAPRGSQATLPSFDRDVLTLLEAANIGRLPALVPIRYGRMLQSPFAFYRGAAGVMAHDLASTSCTGLEVQLCGDCHLLNFGIYGTPERNLVFDINDFDETLPGPWEWDVKRLATSLVMAARYRGFGRRAAEAATLAALTVYRERLAVLSAMPPLDVWYSRLAETDLLGLASPGGRRAPQRLLSSARQHNAASLLPKLTATVAGQLRLRDDPPLLFHVPDDAFTEELPRFLEAYGHSLPDSRSVLLNRYHVADVALKVVGVGSVGTRCFAVLLVSPDQQPLILQLKQAGQSVLASYAGRSRYEHQGRRVVEGQRLMQAATDLFLGWARSDSLGLDFYVRQMRDWKGSLDLEGMRLPSELAEYGEFCGWALARAHARAGGQAAEMSGYLGTCDRFERAVVAFAFGYADQVEQDYATLQAAVRRGAIQAAPESAERR